MVWPTFQRGRAVPLWVPVWVLLEMPVIRKATSTTVATKSCARQGLTVFVCTRDYEKDLSPELAEW